ncbi:TolC family protein [Sphingobium yanoikuyae]|uniref:TolC family protein n=1 Tax=Sphingobium yanoikuyae TaxID=13690 RepID=A0A6M4G8U6_SPHYA|nr:TolC family protein [Sphingobium yanoikuyae]QJR03665.1 TolC family protein [Sphingobium yanoikuyae]
MIRALLLSATALITTPAFAQRTDLPPEPLVVEALDSHPAVAAAQARVRSAEAGAAMLRRGAHEFTFQGTVSRRSAEGEGDYGEYDVNLTRPFRLPGKASLDRKAGELGVEVAHNLMEDVRHQTALAFSDLWHDWLVASAQHRTDLDSAASLTQDMAAVRRRAQLRDASLLDVDQAEAALAQAQAQAATSRAARDEARVKLAAGFPGLALPEEAPLLADPAMPATALEDLRNLVIERSHEIRASEREAQRLAMVARRASADRIADPSFGVRVFSERGGLEKGVGLVGSIPLGGGYRRAAHDQATADASAAELELTRVRREIEATAAADLSNVRAREAVWRSMESAAASAAAAATRTKRGYELGQIDLADTLLARRQANEARRQEIDARATLLRAILRIQIDAHEVWTSQEGHED